MIALGRIFFAATLSSIAMAATTPAFSLTNAQIDFINSQVFICNTVDSDVGVAACSVAIASGQFSGNDLALFYYNRAVKYGKMRKLALAISDASNAIALKPNFARAYYLRGLVKSVSGDAAGADRDIAIAKDLDPNVEANSI